KTPTSDFTTFDLTTLDFFDVSPLASDAGAVPRVLPRAGGAVLGVWVPAHPRRRPGYGVQRQTCAGRDAGPAGCPVRPVRDRESPRRPRRRPRTEGRGLRRRNGPQAAPHVEDGCGRRPAAEHAPTVRVPVRRYAVGERAGAQRGRPGAV